MVEEISQYSLLLYEEWVNFKHNWFINIKQKCGMKSKCSIEQFKWLCSRLNLICISSKWHRPCVFHQWSAGPMSQQIPSILYYPVYFHICESNSFINSFSLLVLSACELNTDSSQVLWLQRTALGYQNLDYGHCDDGSVVSANAHSPPQISLRSQTVAFV